MLRGVLCAVLFGPAVSMPASAYSSLSILGDSLSDSGNFAAVYGGAIAGGLIGPPAFPPAIPSNVYFPGTFSNGPNYSVALAGALGLQANPSVLGGTNYAFGAARTGYHGLQALSPQFRGLVQQRDKLLADHPVLDADGLYVVFGGSNNVQDILNSALTGTPAPTSVGATVGDIGGIVNDLFTHGAGTVMVVNLPDLGLVPRITELGATAVNAARSFSVAINAGIAGEVAKQEAQGRNVIAFDLFSLLNGLMANPGAVGITNTTGRCFAGDDINFFPGGAVCGNPDEHVFWDGIHPTAKVHAILGNAMAVAAVPEPETWALLCVGIVFVAVARRKALAR